jgi:RNA polymerase sigma-70 factor (ECF subfamily)
MDVSCPGLICAPVVVSNYDGSGDAEREALAAVARGDTVVALRCLMQRYGTAVYRYCRAALHDAALADDVHQQIFLAAFRDLARFHGRSSLRTWLFAVARHRVLDAVKSRRRMQNQLTSEVPGEIGDSRPLADETIDEVRLQEALVTALRELDEDTRTAVLLRYQQGLTLDEMSEVCSEKPGTLGARLKRAMPRLRVRIEALLGTPHGEAR